MQFKLRLQLVQEDSKSKRSNTKTVEQVIAEVEVDVESHPAGMELLESASDYLETQGFPVFEIED